MMNGHEHQRDLGYLYPSRSSSLQLGIHDGQPRNGPHDGHRGDPRIRNYPL